MCLELTKQFFHLVLLSKYLKNILKFHIFANYAPLVQEQQNIFVWKDMLIHSESSHLSEGLKNHNAVFQYRTQRAEKLNQYGRIQVGPIWQEMEKTKVTMLNPNGN